MIRKRTVDLNIIHFYNDTEYQVAHGISLKHQHIFLLQVEKLKSSLPSLIFFQSRSNLTNVLS